MSFALIVSSCGQVRGFFSRRVDIWLMVDRVDQSRKCPLCAQTIGEYLIHRIRSRYDYQKHFLQPLSKPGLLPLRATLQQEPQVRRRRRRRDWGRRDEEEADKLDRSIEKRRWVYEHGLYAKVR